MANTHSIPARPVGDHAPPTALSDADLASRSPLAAKARATTFVPDVNADEAAAYRARLIELYVEARERRVALHLWAEATRYDQAHPGEPSLRDELLGTQYMAVA